MDVAVVRVRVRVFLEYPARDALKYLRDPDLARVEGIRPNRGRWLGLQPAVHQMLSLSSLYNYSQRSSRPQPLGSRREAAPCDNRTVDCSFTL